MQSIIKVFRNIVYLHISFLLRNKRVYVICGMRRSGNHACINWLLNALEASSSTFIPIDSDRCYVSEKNKTLFFNEANYYGLRFFWSLLWAQRRKLHSVENVIISLEDYVPDENSDPYAPKNSTPIIVERRTLNLVASRLQRLLNQAMEGKDRGDMGIDRYFFEKLHRFSQKRDHKWKRWSFESWLLNEENYQEKFLDSIGLSVNITPNISTHGGGSSFTGQTGVPSSSEILSRWEKVNWPNRVLMLLDENKDLLDKTEIDFVHAKKL